MDCRSSAADNRSSENPTRARESALRFTLFHFSVLSVSQRLHPIRIRSNRQRGFTLAELLTVVVLVGITTSMAAPTFSKLLKNQRITAASNELLTSLMLARSSAITTRSQTVVCPSANSASAKPTCGGSWEDGWIVFTDLDGNGEVTPPQETLWEQHPALGGTIEIGAPAALVRFQPIGTAPGSNGTFAVCDDRADDTGQRKNMREVILAFAGRARVVEADGDTACP